MKYLIKSFASVLLRLRKNPIAVYWGIRDDKSQMSDFLTMEKIAIDISQETEDQNEGEKEGEKEGESESNNACGVQKLKNFSLDNFEFSPIRIKNVDANKFKDAFDETSFDQQQVRCF